MISSFILPLWIVFLVSARIIIISLILLKIALEFIKIKENSIEKKEKRLVLEVFNKLANQKNKYLLI